MDYSVQIKQLVSDEARAEFLKFFLLPFFFNKPNLKIWRTRKYTLTSIKQIPSYELYTLLCAVLFPLI
jgi:hypothetical protein